MPEIHNIRGVYNVNTKRTIDKLTFQIGEEFLARIISAEEGEGEYLLKLLDGWKFPAKFKNPLDSLPEGLTKFQVEGFEDGKLILKLLQDKIISNKLGDSIEEFLKNNNMDLTKKDYEVLNGMVKHGIPLTKENISYVKTLTSFMERFQDQENMDNFIYKYLSSKNISVDSKEGQYIKGVLKDFFQSLNKLELGDILTLCENNIDISKDNIDSFINIFKNSSSVFNELKTLEKNINNIMENNVESNNGLNSQESSLEVQKNTATANEDLKENFNNIIKEKLQGNHSVISDTEDLKENNSKAVSTNNIKENSEGNSSSTTAQNAKENSKDTIKENSIGNLKENNKEFIKRESSEKNITDGVEQKDGSYKIKEDLKIPKNLSEEVKNQVELKTQEMKNIVKDLVDKLLKPDMKNYDKVLDLIKSNMNDFKIFNSLSNEYYYLDLPINIREDAYECKLIIKDDRKKGKTIDTKNVKIAASVKTINMGVVDAFIKVNNSIMDIEINCNGSWIKPIEKNKTKLLEMLSSSSYNIYVKVEEKKEEFSLPNCREFFDDTYLNNLNVKV